MNGAKGRRRSDLFADVLLGPFSAQKVSFLFAFVGWPLHRVAQVAVVVAVVAVGIAVVVVSFKALLTHSANIGELTLSNWERYGSIGSKD